VLHVKSVLVKFDQPPWGSTSAIPKIEVTDLSGDTAVDMPLLPLGVAKAIVRKLDPAGLAAVCGDGVFRLARLGWRGG
jgi:hypothetical protein